MNAQVKNIIRNCKALIAQFIFAILFIAPSTLYCQQFPGIQWQKCVGGTDNDWTNSIIQTSDGGYIAAGTTLSQSGDFVSNHGTDGLPGNNLFDGWVTKFDSLGSIEWEECLGGTGEDWLNSIIQTNDGGYIAAGSTNSSDGDVSGQHGGENSYDLHPNSDAWIVKLNASGSIEWQKCLGGLGVDDATSIIQNSDTGYTFVGSTTSTDGDVSRLHYAGEFISDIWVVRITSLGKIKWQKCLGGSDQDEGYSIIQDSDSSYVIAGFTKSSDGDVVGFHTKSYKNADGWIVKVNDTGKVIWQKCLGGSGYTELKQIIKTKDGGYAVAGNTYCTDGDVSGIHGGEDAWVVKLNSGGNIQWQKCFGGSKDDQVYSIIQTPDSGYALAGSTPSTDENMPFNHGKSDAWIFKLDSLGNMQWQKCLGGSGDDGASSIITTSDGGYAIAGSTTSHDGDVSGQHGDSTNKTGDAWIIKLNGLDRLGVIPASAKEELSFSTYPNPSNSQMTIHTNSDVKLSSAEFFDMLGRKWQCPFEMKDDHNMLIHTSGLPSGNYVGRTALQGKNYMIPFVVQH